MFQGVFLFFWRIKGINFAIFFFDVFSFKLSIKITVNPFLLLFGDF